MNSIQLKIIVIVAMFVDHFGLIFLEPQSSEYILCRALGRIALPLVCYLLVEGYLHTRNRKRYAGRLAIFAVLSEFPYFYLVVKKREEILAILKEQNTQTFAELTEELQTKYQDWAMPITNILFTLLLCFGMLALVDLICRRADVKKNAKETFEIVKKMALLLLVMFGVVLVSYLFNFDSGVIAPIYVLGFFYFRNDKNVQLVIGAMMAVAYSGNIPYAIGMLAAVVIIKLYNGKLGYTQGRNPLLQYSFYIFYPFHLAILSAIKFLL